MYGSAFGSVSLTNTWPARHSPRKIAPYVRETFESTFERWMKTPAKPAVTSSDAGISPTSSRLRALIPPARVQRCASASSVQLPELDRSNEVLRVRLRAKLIVEQGGAPVGGNERG